MVVLSYVLRRMLRRWPLVLTVGFGVLIATALLASAPLLTNTVMEFSFQQGLNADLPLSGNLRVSSSTGNDRASIDAVFSDVQSAANQYLAPYTGQIITSTGTHWLFPWLEDELRTDIRVNIVSYQDSQAQTSILDGKWPTLTAFSEGVLPVVISEETAYALNLRIGDDLPLSLSRSDGEAKYTMRIAGIVQARVPGDTYWFGMFGPLQPELGGRYDAQYSALVPADIFLDVANAWFPRSHVQVDANILLNHNMLSFGELAQIEQALEDFNHAFDDHTPSIEVVTQLNDVLTAQSQRAASVRIPLYVMLAEITLLALYYVMMTASLSIRQSESEFATLSSRGASKKQMLLIQTLEACVLSLVALLSGPGVAGLMIRALVAWGPMQSLNTSAQLFSPMQSAWIASALGAIVSFVSLLMPVGRHLNDNVIAQRQLSARNLRKPWWQRMYLDVIAMALSMVLLWRIRLYGGIMVFGVDTAQLDWLLLLSPVALLLGTATILLRLFPPVLRLLAGITAQSRGIVSPLALWPSSRDPTHVARLVLLLTLAMALGVLSTGINATLDVSETERAAYAVGADYRVQVKSFTSDAQIANAPDVIDYGLAWRGTASSYLLGSYSSIDILGVDVPTVLSAASFRDDFATEPIEELVQRLEVVENAEALSDVFGDITLPGHPGEMGFWLWAPPEAVNGLPSSEDFIVLGTSNHERVSLHGKLKTYNGFFIDAPLTPRISDTCRVTCWDNMPCDPKAPWSRLESYQCSWIYYAMDIPTLPDDAYPLTLDSIWMRNRVKADFYNSIRTLRDVLVMLAIDDISIVDADTHFRYMVEDFENPTTIWATSEGASRYKPIGGHNAPARHDLMPIFNAPGHTIRFGPYQTDLMDTVPALISVALAESSGLREGDIFHAWIDSVTSVPLEVVGIVTYFPTLYDPQPTESSAGFVVTGYQYIMPRLNTPVSRSINPNEIWISTAEGDVTTQSITKYVPDPTDIASNAEYRQALQANPFTLGLRSATLFGFLITGLLSVIGFFTYFYMSTRQRATVYGVLRAQGLSPVQLYASLFLEQTILILWGLGLGSGLGIALNRLVLSGLPISLGDLPPVPPFIPQDEWASILQLYILLAVTFILVIGLATYSLWRAKLHHVLRIGQE